MGGDTVDQRIGFREGPKHLDVPDDDPPPVDRDPIERKALEGSAEVFRRHPKKGRQGPLFERQVELQGAAVAVGLSQEVVGQPFQRRS